MAEPRLGASLLDALTKDFVSLVGGPLPNTTQILLGYAIRRVRTLWSGPAEESTIVAINGRQFRARREADGRLTVDTSEFVLPGLDGSTSITIKGKFDRGDAWTQAHLVPGDPVALLFERASSVGRATSGLLLPARYGESFEFRAPQGPYRISAYALDRFGASIDSNRTVRALGSQQLGENRTLFGREKIALQVRPSLRRLAYTSSSWSTAARLDVAVATRERVRVAPLEPPLPFRQARSSAVKPRLPRIGPTAAAQPAVDQRCVAKRSPGRCDRPRLKGYVLCIEHAAAAAHGKRVRRFDNDLVIRVRCNADLKKGGRCDRDAVMAVDGPPFRAYCVKHMERVEPEPGRCRALTRAGVRCSNPVMSDHGELCSSHSHAAGPFDHYAARSVSYAW